jgi:hypothetical protein
MENGMTYRAGSAVDLRRVLSLAAADPGTCALLGAQAARDASGYTADRVFQPILAALERMRPVRGARTVPIRHELIQER